MEAKNIVKFLEKTFPANKPEVAVDFAVNQRWGSKETIVCPHCKQGGKIWHLSSVNQPYKCGHCSKKFSVKTGTFMASSKLTVREWLVIMFFMGNSKHSISSLQLADILGIDKDTAWYACQRIRRACQSKKIVMRGICEVDETYFGGKEKNKHSVNKFRAGRGIANKTPVVGIKERNGKVVAKVVENTDKQTLQGFIADNVKQGSAVVSDEHRSYTGLDKLGYEHHKVNHSAGQYVDGVAHTNGIESFWAVLKRTIYGTHHWVSKGYLQRYVDEATFKASNKDFIGTIMTNPEV